MAAPAPLATSYWPADDSGAVRETTVGDLLREAAAMVPTRPALVDAVEDTPTRRTWTYAEFLTDAERAARALLARFSPGERVAIWAPNSAHWVILQQAMGLAGLVLVPVNPAYRARELEYVLRQSGAAGLFHTDAYRGLDLAALVADLRPKLPALRAAISFADWEPFTADGDPARELPAVTPTDLLQIQYTSGTTGFPKGALLHHRGLVNAAIGVADRAGMPDGGVNINAMPMYHIGGGAVTSMGTLAKRGTFVVLPGFDPALMLEAFETYRGTHTLVVPTMLMALLDHPDREKRDLSSIQAIMTGATTVPAALIRRTVETLGTRTTILFGQTEMHGVVTQTRLTDTPEDQAETVGQPLPRIEVKIADPDTGDVQPLGEPGEICCRSYQNMVGYHDMPEETAAAIDADGWLHMGDLGTMDERGFVRVTGRIKDMIIRGGINLYPREIEEVLLDHPAIAEAAVVGVPDEKWGEQIAAIIRLVPGACPPSIDELRVFCRTQMSAHKTPTYWTFTDQLPATPSGKVQKFLLREQLASGQLVTHTAQEASHDGGELAGGAVARTA
jgi:fatty-acyl-CoA synthase